MKFLENLQTNANSKIYISGLIALIIILFVLIAVIFLVIIARNLNIVMSQPAGVTYTYFILVTDRLLAVITLLGLLPLTFYQFFGKNKSKIDNTITIFALVVFLIFAGTFFAGEYYVLNKYKNGDLIQSKMFDKPTVETKIFDKILK